MTMARQLRGGPGRRRGAGEHLVGGSPPRATPGHRVASGWPAR